MRVGELARGPLRRESSPTSQPRGDCQRGPAWKFRQVESYRRSYRRGIRIDRVVVLRMRVGAEARRFVLRSPRGETGETAMPITESTPRRLVLTSGSTTLTLDKDAS